jgi:DNA-directed RNA polymerase subunit RPC12/RpoP
MADLPILPKSREEVTAILDTYLLEKAVYELSYELNNRPDWVKLPLFGILQLLGAEEQAKAPPTKKPPLTICPVCGTEFYVVYTGELPSEVYVNCPNCQTKLVVDFRKTGKGGGGKPDKVTPEAKRPEAIQKTQEIIEGNGGKARKKTEN